MNLYPYTSGRREQKQDIPHHKLFNTKQTTHLASCSGSFTSAKGD